MTKGRNLAIDAGFVCLLSAGLLSPALAQTAEPAAGTAEQEAGAEEWYDTGRESVAESLNGVARWFDGFFGDPGFIAETEARAYLQLIFDAFYSGVPGESDYKVRVRGSADLPRFNERLKLVITSDADASLTGEDLTGIERDLDTRDAEDNAGVGLRYLFRDRPGHKFSLGAGLSGGVSPDLAVNARYRYTKTWTAATASHVVPTLFWKSGDGFGISTLIDYEWVPEPETLWRYSVFGKYGESTDGLEWSTQGSWSHRLDTRTAIGVRGGIKGETEPRQILKEGWLNFRYRRNFHRTWLFYEVEPGLSWHEKVDYRTEPTIALRLEVHFSSK